MASATIGPQTYAPRNFGGTTYIGGFPIGAPMGAMGGVLGAPRPQSPPPQAAPSPPVTQPGYHGTQPYTPPGQSMSGLGQFGSTQFRPAPAYTGATYTGHAQGMPYGQANAQTWGTIGNMLGANSSVMGSALTRLNPAQQAFAADYAQRYLGVPVPGDGRGVNVNPPSASLGGGPIFVHQGISPLTHPPAAAPGTMSQPGLGMSRFNAITNMVNQRLGR